ncbi:MAG: metal transporter permease, partial [Paenibacillus sp.]|nr:metal transporter permease [Paenibacillus sp.]
MSYAGWILLTASLVGLSCGFIGVLLILRRMAMMADAISHTVLLGIVTA